MNSICWYGYVYVNLHPVEFCACFHFCFWGIFLAWEISRARAVLSLRSKGYTFRNVAGWNFRIKGVEFVNAKGVELKSKLGLGS